MSRYHWAANPERQLDEWRLADPERTRTGELTRTVDFAEQTHTLPDGTVVSDGWVCAVGELEPCTARGGKVRVVRHFTGPDRAAAADKALTRIAEVALTRSIAQQKTGA